ncbi:MAG: hypothetical protein KGO82_08395 [Bacteroidota bacterium]|nr:hypothetical protein [Bacteroidota bacterium]
MRKNIIALLVVALAITGVWSCKKDKISGDSKDLIMGSYLTLGALINGNLDFSNQAATVSMKVGSRGEKVASVNVYASPDGGSDKSTWKLIKTLPYSDSMVISVSTGELAKALAPGTIEPGNQYVLQNEVVTASGAKYSAANTPTNFSSFPAYKFGLTWKATAVCAFSQAASVGAYKVVSDDNWQDYAPGDTLTVFPGPDANSLSFYAYPAVQAGGVNRKPWIVKVDAATGTATMASQAIGSYGSVVSSAKASGFVFSCTGVITLSVDVNYGGTVYAAQVLTIKKQ